MTRSSSLLVIVNLPSWAQTLSVLMAEKNTSYSEIKYLYNADDADERL